MLELVDKTNFKSLDHYGHVGSIPSSSTKSSQKLARFFFDMFEYFTKITIL